MKKYILTFVIALLSLYTQAQQMPLPDPNSPNILFIKYKKNLDENNTILSDKNEAQVRVYPNGIKDWAWTDSYMYIAKNNTGGSINEEFYTPNKEY
nr:hypothetical protein [Raineya sp.]